MSDDTVWQSMVSITDRMLNDPRGKVSAELAQTRAQLLALKAQRHDQIDDLMARVARVPHDEEARQLLEQGTERLADLQIAESILNALFE